MQEKIISTSAIRGSGNGYLKVERRADGQLWAISGDGETTVRVISCFPWSKPNRYISLRDDEEKEIALIHQLTELDDESRNVVEEALAQAGFVMEIVKVISFKEDFEIRSWRVITSQGDRKFQTKLDDWPYKLPSGGLLIRDVAGDLFHINDPDTLDEQSRNLLKAFVG